MNCSCLNHSWLAAAEHRPMSSALVLSEEAVVNTFQTAIHGGGSFVPRVRLQAEVLTFGSPARPRHRAHVKELFPAPANKRRPLLSNKALERIMVMSGSHRK
jgi:hypothetical protein